MDAQGRLTYEEDAAVGRQRLQEAIDFVRKYDGTAQGRLRGMLNAAQVETCSERLLRAGKDAARELGVPIHTHAGGNLVEFQRIMDEYRKTPIQFLADIGFLDARTLLGHAVFTTAHPWSRYAFGDDLRVLADAGATVGHCPYKYAKMAMTLHSLPGYLAAGVTIALGTDTYPLDMVAELRWASILAKVTDANYQAGLPRDVFNAATLGGTKFIDRPDLGRLAAGAKADILLINLDQLGPIRSRRSSTAPAGAMSTRSSSTEESSCRAAGPRASTRTPCTPARGRRPSSTGTRSLAGAGTARRSSASFRPRSRSSARGADAPAS
jgi:cytosine/adenosine deaminase-related metal-dependent hydrolase